MKTEAQIWDEVLDEVRERWARGALTRTRDGEKKHCAIGAIAHVVLGERWCDLHHSEDHLFLHPETGPLMHKLAKCLIELNPHELQTGSSEVNWIVHANDVMGQDTIIEAIEKARAL